MGLPGKLPDIFIKIEVNVRLLTRLLGVKQKIGNKNNSAEIVQKIKLGDMLLVNVGSTAVGGRAVPISSNSKSNIIAFELANPVCAEIGEKIAISRKIENSWRLIGWGDVLKGYIVNKIS